MTWHSVPSQFGAWGAPGQTRVLQLAKHLYPHVLHAFSTLAFIEHVSILLTFLILIGSSEPSIELLLNTRKHPHSFVDRQIAFIVSYIRGDDPAYDIVHHAGAILKLTVTEYGTQCINQIVNLRS